MASKMTLDFSKVKDGGGFSPKHKPEGEYLGTITTFEDTKSKAGNAMWVFGVALKSDRRAVYPVYCTLNEESLWKLRQVLMACGVKVPKKRLSVDANRLVGRDLGICLEDDEYEGKKKSVISTFFPASEYSGDTDDDGDEDLPEEDEYEDDDDTEDTDSDDAGDDDSDEDDSDDEEDEVEEEPEPAPKKKAAKRSAPARAKVKKAAPADEAEDELDLSDEDDEDDEDDE